MILPPWLWRLTHSRTFWIALPSTLVVLVLLFFTIANIWGNRKLDAVRADLAQRGYALTWADLMKSNPPADEDLNRHEVVRRNHQRLDHQLESMGYRKEDFKFLGLDPKDGKRLSAAAICGKPGTDEPASVEQLLRDFAIMEPVASEIKMAVRTSRGIGTTITGSPPRATEQTSINLMDWMNRFILSRAMLRAAGGDPNGAMDDLRVVLEYDKLYQNQPQSMIRSLVGMALTVAMVNHAWLIIQQPSMSEDQLREIDRWMSELDHGKSTVNAYRHEMVSLNEHLTFCFGPITAVSPESMEWKFDWKDTDQWWPTARRWWRQVRPVGLAKMELAAALERIDKEIIHLPDEREREAWTAEDAERIAAMNTVLPCDYEDAKFQDRIYTAAEPMIRRHLKVRSSVRLARMAIAAELYRRDHGSFPDSVDSLVPTYLQQPLIDAQSEKPIQIERAHSGTLMFTAPGSDAKTRLRWPFPAK